MIGREGDHVEVIGCAFRNIRLCSRLRREGLLEDMSVRKFAHLALAAALTVSSAVGAATLFPTNAAAFEQPWLIITYVSGGKPVGNTQVFCDSPDITQGDTTNYDNIVYTYYFMCP
jgi:hypothetical protein